jgi:uncharacterized protein YpmB
MEDGNFILYLYFISAIIGLIILYFIISSATKANKQVELQAEMVQLLKIIAKNTSAARIDAFNAKNSGVSIQGYDAETDKATVLLAEVAPHGSKFNKNTQERIEVNYNAEYKLIQISLSELNEALK